MKHKHLTYDDRLEIQNHLKTGFTFRAISHILNKDPSTISKEIRRHLKPHLNSYSSSNEMCPLLSKPPYCCNACKHRRSAYCKHIRYLYEAKHAHLLYESLLHESREGIPLNKESFYQIEKLISTSVSKGQHIYHIIKTHNIPISKSTIYRHINKGYYTVGKIDLPRAVKFKTRRKKITYVPKKMRLNRTFLDFNNYLLDNNISSYIEMDTIIGRIGGKAILTLHFTSYNFMIGILLNDKTSSEVTKKLQHLKQTLNRLSFSFSDLFPLILTDNGGEFSNVSAIEYDEFSDSNSSLFFCDPNSPSQKGKIEKNHTLFRDIVPKGSSFDSFTQETVDLIFSHVNAVKRANFNGKSAYDMFTFAFTKMLASALNISFIPPEDVVQSPALLKKSSK